MPLSLEASGIAHLLPEDQVGTVLRIEPIGMGLSGAHVYAVTTTRGELVLRINAPAESARFDQELRVLRRAAAQAVAPPILHVDVSARAIVSARVSGDALPVAFRGGAPRATVIGSVVAQLRTLHALDMSDILPRDPLAYAREQYAQQRLRAGFPAWASALEPTLEAIEATLARDPRSAVSHNDLNPGNIMWDGERAWLVDWEVAGITHPFYDLATLAMFLQLNDPTAQALLAAHEQRTIDDRDRASFSALRQLVALLCGSVFLSLVPNLSSLPKSAPSLAEFYADLQAGDHDLHDPRGRGTFGLALLKLATDTGSA